MKGVSRAAADEVGRLLAVVVVVAMMAILHGTMYEGSKRTASHSARRGAQAEVDGEWMDNCGPVMEQFRFGREASFTTN